MFFNLKTYLVNFQNYLLISVSFSWLLKHSFYAEQYCCNKYLLDNFVEDASGKGQVNAETYHWEVDATTLGCAELQAERIRHSALIDSVAEKVIENSSRSTS